MSDWSRHYKIFNGENSIWQNKKLLEFSWFWFPV